MSTRHQSEEVRQILHDVRTCTAEELLALHGVEITSTGQVIDHTYNLTHENVDAWIAVLDADDSGGYEKFSKYGEEEY